MLQWRQVVHTIQRNYQTSTEHVQLPGHYVGDHYLSGIVQHLLASGMTAKWVKQCPYVNCPQS